MDVTRFVPVYMDDMVIFSVNWPDHLDHVDQALQGIGEAGLTVKQAKCCYAMYECPYWPCCRERMCQARGCKDLSRKGVLKHQKRERRM